MSAWAAKLIGDLVARFSSFFYKAFIGWWRDKAEDEAIDDGVDLELISVQDARGKVFEIKGRMRGYMSQGIKVPTSLKQELRDAQNVLRRANAVLGRI